MGRSIVGNPRRHVFKFLFRVEGKPFNQTDTGFTTVSGLEMALETVKHRQGGSLIPAKYPGLGDFPPVTLSRGATTDIHAINAWAQLCLNAAYSTSLRNGGAQGGRTPDPVLYKNTIDIVETDGAGNPARIHRLYGAWVSNFKPIVGLDNNASEITMEELTLEYDYFELVDTKAMKLNLFASSPGLGALSISNAMQPAAALGKDRVFKIG